MMRLVIFIMSIFFLSSCASNSKNVFSLDYLYSSANQKESLGLYDEAIIYYKEAISRYPKNSTYTFWKIGYCYFKKKDYQNAIDEFSKAINSATLPRNHYITDCYNIRGLSYVAIGNYASAISDFTNGINYNEQFYPVELKEIINNNGKIQYDFSEAIVLYCNKQQFLLNRAKTYEQINQIDKAIDDYEMVAKKDKRNAICFESEKVKSNAAKAKERLLYLKTMK